MPFPQQGEPSISNMSDYYINPATSTTDHLAGTLPSLLTCNLWIIYEEKHLEIHHSWTQINWLITMHCRVKIFTQRAFMDWNGSCFLWEINNISTDRNIDIWIASEFGLIKEKLSDNEFSWSSFPMKFFIQVHTGNTFMVFCRTHFFTSSNNQNSSSLPKK